MADYNYRNINPKSEDTRYKINNNIIRMMNANPALGTGYLIGNMIGENYWGKKRAKRRSEVKDAWDKLQGSSGGEVKYSGTSKEPNYYDSMNKAFDEYTKNNPGNAYIDTASGVYPRTPQQANKSTKTPTMADAWRKMENGSTYNPGSTPVGNPTGARDLGNVMPQTQGKVLFEGIPSSTASAPSVANFPQKPANGPAPYTDDQLRQIAAQNFTPDELSRMTTEAERARMNALMNPTPAATIPAGGGLLNSIANAAVQAAQQTARPDAAPNLAVINTTPASAVDAAENLAVLNAIDEEPTQSAYKGTNWRNVFANPYQVEGPNAQIGFRYVADKNNPSFLDALFADDKMVAKR